MRQNWFLVLLALGMGLGVAYAARPAPSPSIGGALRIELSIPETLKIESSPSPLVLDALAKLAEDHKSLRIEIRNLKASIGRR